jgi:hypothetical protein
MRIVDNFVFNPRVWLLNLAFRQMSVIVPDVQMCGQCKKVDQMLLVNKLNTRNCPN